MLDERRRELLAAIGIELYCLRTSVAVEAPQPGGAVAGAETARAGGGMRLAVAVPRGVREDPRVAPLLAQVVRALGIGAAEVAWIEAAGAGVDAPLPDVDCYLMLGAAAARAGSTQIPLERQAAATIAVSADPGELFRDAAGRRELWQTLKPLVRRLRNAC